MSFVKALRATSKVMSFGAKQKAAGSPAQPLGYTISSGRTIRQPLGQLDPTTAVVEGYKASVWVFACVFRLAQACSSIPWQVLIRDDQGNWIPDELHPLQKVLDNPNPKMSRKELFFWEVAWLALTGNALWQKVMLNDNPFNSEPGSVAELWPLAPRNVGLIADEKEWITDYELSIAGRREIVPANLIVHAKLPDPDNVLWGTGMLQPAWPSVQSDTAGAEWRAKTFERGGVPSGAIVDKTIFSDEALREAEVMLERSWSRAGEGGRPMILTSGDQWLNFSSSADELQFLQGRQFTVYEIVTSFGMLPAMFEPGASTYDNLQTAVRWMYDHGVASLMDVIEDSFNRSLIPEKDQETTWIHYDTSGVPAYRAERAQKLSLLQTAIHNGIALNEAFTFLDLPFKPVKGGDVPMVDGGLVPVSESALGMMGQQNPEEDPIVAQPLDPINEVEEEPADPFGSAVALGEPVAQPVVQQQATRAVATEDPFSTDSLDRAVQEMLG